MAGIVKVSKHRLTANKSATCAVCATPLTDEQRASTSVLVRHPCADHQNFALVVYDHHPHAVAS